MAEKRPRADGSWRTLGTLQVTFSRVVRNPRLHLSGLAALTTGAVGSTGTATRLTVTGGSPAAPGLVGRTGWPGWTVDAGELTPTGDGANDGSAAGAGTLELAGTLGTATLRVEQRSTVRDGAGVSPAALSLASTVTVDEGLGTAPQGYGNASHVISDLFLGQDAAGGSVRARPGLTATVAQPLVPGEQPARPLPFEQERADRPAVELDRGAGVRSAWASSPAPPQYQPGRSEYPGADPTLAFPAEAAVGRYYGLTVPVGPGGGPAVLAGWIDFDHNGRFDPLERVQADVPAGSGTAALEWTVPGVAASGDTWARLRIARNGAQLVLPDGFADSGEVVDQRVRIAVGAAPAEISRPVAGTTTADPRPEVRGEGAVQGATVAVLEGEAELCRTTVGPDGGWSCRPGSPLGPGPHTLTPVETTGGGLVLRGTGVGIVVKTAPPAAPVFTVPEFTNDPGLLLTGTGEPHSTVSVALADRPGGAGAANELCSTEVGAGREWSCLPVENLPDGEHRLGATAVDRAGNRTDGRPVTLTVDTVAPGRPQLASPAAGETLPTARPRLSGRAEAGTTVTVTARAAGGERVTVCSAVAGADSAWSCTASRDLPPGAQRLLATATDRAGNGTTGEEVAVTVAPAASAAASSSPSSSPSASPSVVSSAAGPATVPAGAEPVLAPPVPGLLPIAVPPAPLPVASVPSDAAPATPPAAPSPVPPAASSAAPSATPGAGRSASPPPSPSLTSSGGGRTLAAPPAAADAASTTVRAVPGDDAPTAARDAPVTGWRRAGVGVLLILLGLGLVTRRVYGRGSGARRRH
ncbi:Ig-like domain-containing protein [Kitasatospora sp. NPDC088346]|uniref:Ig-like domain-containing protein n=1 Tax=Kitasatospora sp. NPDC088346 TaxID=3364073 RepID=UPI003806B286